MDMNQVLIEHSDKLFVCDGIGDGEAYMLIDGMKLYISLQDLEMAESMPIGMLISRIKTIDTLDR